MAAIALQNIGSDCIRIIAAVVGDSSVYGGISGSRIAVGGSENIMNVVAATPITAVKIMSGGSGDRRDSRTIGIGNARLAMSRMKFRCD